MTLEEVSRSSAKEIRAPLMKWPGGKRALVSHIVATFPQSFKTYYEPFFGGGAIFFAVRPKNAILADVNDDLINCYRVVRDSPDELIRVLKTYKNSEEDYYQLRGYRPRTEIRRAARFLYLTRLSFNGIHRVNLKGEFNVPYGSKTHLDVLDEDLIRAASGALTTSQLLTADFETATIDAGPGDLVYFDPPYTVAHANNGFIKYNERIFSWADQVRLAGLAEKLQLRGCTVIVSNADHPSVRQLYPDAKFLQIERFSVISASAKHRTRITESIFVLNGGRHL